MKYITRDKFDRIDLDKCKNIIDTICEYIRTQTDIVVIGMSGGADSTLVTALCQIALLDKTDIIGISMPYNTTDSATFNRRSVNLANHLGIDPRVITIKDTVDAFKTMFGDMTQLNEGNLRSRTRMMLLYATAGQIAATNTRRVRVIGTGNLSEDFIGYDTKGGDALADFFPLGDLYKQEVYDLLDCLVLAKVILEEHIDRTPSAGLWEGQTDEAELGYTYNEMAPAIEFLRANPYYIENGIPEFLGECMAPVVEFVRLRHLANRHKHLAPPVLNLRGN